MTNFFSSLAALWELAVLALAVGTLAWFFYWVYLRRILRARRIARLRDKRMLREAAERRFQQTDDSSVSHSS
jgi:O-antigen/teichoic acid export membrane protein